MKTLLSLTMVLAFLVAIPQCFGQDACQSPAQLLEEQQLVQMSLLLMAPPTIVAVPVSNLLMAPPGCIKCCGDARNDAVKTICNVKTSPAARKECREKARESYRICSGGCHAAGTCDFPPIE